MKVSLNLIKQLINFELPPVDELVSRVNQQLGGVEEVIDLKAKYGGARIVRVVECEKHPNADRLSVTKIDDSGVADVPRDDNGYVQVVCGAPNVHADMWAIWLPPRSIVPVSFDDAEPFVLDARPLRGILSQGMLAAADELAIGTDHEGIIEINERDIPAGVTLQAGASFAEVFGLDDYVLEIENKMFTHRPDCFGQLGVAREIAGIFHQQFNSPDWYNAIQEFADSDGLELEVFNEANELAPAFSAIAIKNVDIHPSPLWLQCQLVAMGGKPINNIVDATNYVMFMTAQPTHAYDYDKLRGHKLGVRMAHDGEKVGLLNGKEYELTADDIVIADSEGVIGLAGIMGGVDTEVSAETKNIVLECANFDMYALRRTAMRHGIFTDALTRFNKGQSPAQIDPVLKWLIGMVGGEQASPMLFKNHSSLRQVLVDGKHWHGGLLIPKRFVEERLGVDFAENEIEALLKNVEFIVDDGNKYGEAGVMVYSPFWRTDIELPEDIVEEIGRLYGFDRLPRHLPERSIKPAPKNERRELKQKIRQSLSRSGANEVLTYSFVHERVLKNSEQDPGCAYRLSNALSPDLQYYRISILPSLLDKVHANIKSGHDEFMLFEIGKIHDKKLGFNDENLPIEKTFIDVVYANKKPQIGAPFYKVRKIAERLMKDLSIEVDFVKITESDSDVPAPFDAKRSAWIVAKNGDNLGIVGEFVQSARRNFKLPDYTAAFSIDIEKLQENLSKNQGYNYQPLSRFPSTARDISLKMDSNVDYAKVYACAEEVAKKHGELRISITPIAIYQPKNDDSTKTVTLNIKFTSAERTLEDRDIAPIIEEIAAMAAEEFDAAQV